MVGEPSHDCAPYEVGGGDEGDHGGYGDSDIYYEGDAAHGDGDEPRRYADFQPFGGGVYAEGARGGWPVMMFSRMTTASMAAVPMRQAIHPYRISLDSEKPMGCILVVNSKFYSMGAIILNLFT